MSNEAEAVLRLIAARFDPLTRDVAPLLDAALAAERRATVERIRSRARIGEVRPLLAVAAWSPDAALGYEKAHQEIAAILNAEAE